MSWTARAYLWAMEHPSEPKMRRRLLWFIPEDWHAARDEISRRHRQEHYRFTTQLVFDLPLERALIENDFEVHRHNSERGRIAALRVLARRQFPHLLRTQRRERVIIGMTPKRLQPFMAWSLGADITTRAMRRAVFEATRPVPEKRYYTQARNFTPRQKS